MDALSHSNNNHIGCGLRSSGLLGWGIWTLIFMRLPIQGLHKNFWGNDMFIGETKSNRRRTAKRDKELQIHECETNKLNPHTISHYVFKSIVLRRVLLLV